jgi:hypothetical protein
MGICCVLVLLCSETLPQHRRSKFNVWKSNLFGKVVDVYRNRYVDRAVARPLTAHSDIALLSTVFFLRMCIYLGAGSGV